MAVPEAAEQTAHCCLIALAYGVLDGSADGAVADRNAGVAIVIAVADKAAQPAHAVIRAGFIHVPFLPEQTADKPSLPLDKTVAALCAAIEAI